MNPPSEFGRVLRMPHGIALSKRKSISPKVFPTSSGLSFRTQMLNTTNHADNYILKHQF